MKTQIQTSCNKHGYENQSDQESCVSKVSIFNHLDNDQMMEIKNLSKTIYLEKGEILFQAGDDSDSLYIVSKGRVRLYRLSEVGKERLLHILHVGEITGELALFNESKHESYAEAMEQTTICVIKRNELHHLMSKYPSIAIKILHELANRLEMSETQATRFITEKIESRVSLFILECIDKNSSLNEIILPMSKKDLALYLGTTPETISRKLLYLEEKGYIIQKSNKKIKILDLDGLLSV